MDYLLSNGRSTGIEGLDNIPEVLVRATDCASPSSTENSRINAWNVNFGNGNTNTNNKYNSNAVRAVAALGEEIKEGWIEAFHDCCRNKKSSHNCNEYRAKDWELDLWLLVHEVYSRTYTPGPSTCFIVTRPTLREIFAADFRDRIVQHWICLRLEPLFEERFKSQGDVSHNCRKGYGTRSAVDALERDIREVSQNYTRKAWVTKIDVRSFFMSIDTMRLWEFLKRFIRDNYKGKDMHTLLNLTYETVLHRPQLDCIRRSPGELWELLAAHKSLFNRPDGIGVAIGNITSQLEANFYMSFYVEDMLPLAKDAGARIEQFVDDISCVSPTKEFCLKFRKESERILRDRLGLTMHPDKFYLQEAGKGVKFVGTVIKPGRAVLRSRLKLRTALRNVHPSSSRSRLVVVLDKSRTVRFHKCLKPVGCTIKPGRRYINNRTLGSLCDKLVEAERLCKGIVAGRYGPDELLLLRHLVDGINSYLGFMVHTASYRMRRRVFDKTCNAFWKVCYTRDFSVCKIRLMYDFQQFLIKKEIQDYGMDLHHGTAQKGRYQKKSRHEAANRKLQLRPSRRKRPERLSLPSQGGDTAARTMGL